jgi:sulfur carrier protein ThiS adenylyltransferase
MSHQDLHIRSRLSNRIVGIAGCGGLGSNCAVALARVGVGKLIIADFDRVEESNLNRQYFFIDQIGKAKVQALKDNIGRIDPGIIIETHNLVLDSNNIPEIFSDCEVIVEAFDKAEMKQMLIETIIEKLPEKYLVCGSGLAGWGQSESIGLSVSGRIYIFGDGSNEVNDIHPPLAPRVGIVANLEANQVMEILLGKM